MDEPEITLTITLSETDLMVQALLMFQLRHPMLYSAEHKSLLNSFQGIILNYEQEKLTP